jgi:hypothetical protein
MFLWQGGHPAEIGLSAATSSKTTRNRRIPMLSYEEVALVVEYRPEVGGSCLVWKRSSGRAFIGHRAGSPDPKRRYWRLKLLGKLRLAHQIVWLLNTKGWPEKNLDHINGNPEDNSIENLRLCSHSENQQNQSKNRKNASGCIGAHIRGDKWVSEIMVNGARTFLGYFDTPEKASAAYLEAKAQLHTFNPVPR